MGTALVSVTFTMYNGEVNPPPDTYQLNRGSKWYLVKRELRAIAFKYDNTDLKTIILKFRGIKRYAVNKKHILRLGSDRTCPVDERTKNENPESESDKFIIGYKMFGEKS